MRISGSDAETLKDSVDGGRGSQVHAMPVVRGYRVDKRLIRRTVEKNKLKLAQ